MTALVSRASSTERVLFAPRPPALLRPDAAHDDERYRAWIDEQAAGPGRLGHPGRTVDILLVLEAPEPGRLLECLRSVTNQRASDWVLSVVTVGEPSGVVAEILQQCARSLGPERFRRHRVADGTDPAAATATAFEGSGSTMVVLLDQHDQLDPDALSLLGKGTVPAVGSPAVDVVYGDHDHLDGAGRRVGPCFKPDWSPDLFLGAPYFGTPVLLRRDRVVEVGGIRPVSGGDWRHDLILRVTEHSDRVHHVARVLSHRPDEVATGSGDAAVTSALQRRHEGASVGPGPLPGTWSVRRKAARRPSVSVIIPFRDAPGFLRSCVDSVRATAGEVDLEFVLVDNGSVEPETETLLEQLAETPDVAILSDPRPFNWAALNNDAVPSSWGEVLLFLNNDIEARSSGWAESLAAQALRPEIGAVGARLVYPGGRVQHAGVVLGMGGAAGHVLAGLSDDDPGYLGMAVLTRNCSAVTGACMAMRRTVFDELEGFDESLGIDLNDIDFCLRAQASGYRILYEPSAELVHYESPSRGTSGSVANITRFVERWDDALLAGDPYLNRHLTRMDGSCALRGPDEDQWWRDWRSVLQRS